MKRKKIDSVKPPVCHKKGWWIRLQVIEDIAVLNIFRERKLWARHCINTETYEYETNMDGEWSTQNLKTTLGMNDYWEHGDTYKQMEKERFRMSKEDEETLRTLIRQEFQYQKNRKMMRITDAERNYGRYKRGRAEERRIDRVNALMARVPAIPEGIKEWIDRCETGGEDFCMKLTGQKKYSCTSCGAVFDKLPEKVRNNDQMECPECKKKIRYLARKKHINIKTHFCMIQPMDDEVSVARYFTAVIDCEPGSRKEIGLKEDVRIILFKHPQKKKKGIYYEQYTDSEWVSEGSTGTGDFDNKSNRANKREHTGYLYDGGIVEALRDTAYENWGRLFVQMSAAGQKADYNGLMASGTKKMVRVAELLFRGRFYRLLTEESEHTWYSTGAYYGELNLSGSSIEEVFGIADRQKINRIRDKNGGTAMLEWMRWSEESGQKISERALEWLTANGIEVEDMEDAKEHMSVEQTMNYVERQRRESYKGMSPKAVLAQYGDYMEMCEKLHKNVTDEMVYRPRELKRRHDEAVAELERMNAQLKADEYSKKFGEAERVLSEIKDKFEYSGEQFFIMVPERIVDIVAEGNYLHHCAGATDRYFDRIKQHETYICFLRKTGEPEIPFYTIEVEPGGTIRQHRGMYDEEPEIETVKPFLREWQKEIRKRMSREDHERAAVSKVKRQENIDELREKNNTRVLNGLMEDLMEAI
ncbi:MAG: PcfJ domain-containing protein [Lachnospiraceae bacterium]|nr:PcfJ domain-containing protein [Lachnospiraceae bacterium]